MPFLFERNVGRVAEIQDPVAEGIFSLAEITADASDISYASMRSIITKIGVSSACNFQFLHTIGNDVYVYVFGDRMGQIVISGISFQEGCYTATGHGFNRVYDWYTQNKLSNRTEPVIVTVGQNTIFKGFITSLSSDVNDSQNRTISFQLQMSVLPEKR
jgi:hypothetical protein